MERAKHFTFIKSDIAHGNDESRPDYAVIHKTQSKDIEQLIIVVKYKKWFAVFPYLEFMNKDYSTVLNYNFCIDTNNAYQRFMRCIGKMVKKPITSRYFNKKVEEKYTLPEEFVKALDTLVDDLLKEFDEGGEEDECSI